MANEVIWFDSAETGAPTLNNAAGSLIAVLDACLLNGFNLKSITIHVAGGVATATCNGHGFSGAPGKLLQIAGATPAALNGLKQPISVTANTFTFDAAGVPDGAATGAITAKRAPLGWTKAFAGSNRAAYKSSDVAATGRLLRVDDTAAAPASATDARVVMYEAMSDVDTGTGPGPTAAQLAGGAYWGKGTNDATAKPWVVVGDGRLFYFFGPHSGASGLAAYAFGDIVSYRAADAYGCALFGSSSAIGGTSSGGTQLATPSLQLSSAPANLGSVVSRLSSQVGGAVPVAVLGVYTSSAWGSTGAPAWPSPVDNGSVLHRPLYCVESNSAFGHPIRGEMPGMLQFLASQPYTHKEVVTNIDGFAGHSVLVLEIRNNSTIGRFALDLTGPWR
jgi:hypothetical protein